MVIFLFAGFGDLQVLHSFPTHALPIYEHASLAKIDSNKRQRSSAREDATVVYVGLGLVVEHATRQARGFCAGGFRSEEHTSELQSRRDLVCRLLLEKKKQPNPIRS